MKESKFHKICEKCRRCFSKESSSGELCSECTISAKLQKDCEPNTKCSSCGDLYYSPNHYHKCPFCSVKGYSNSIRKEKEIDNTKSTAKKKRRGGVPIQELIRRSEYKRVMDDSGWKHYLKGRKWDKI